MVKEMKVIMQFYKNSLGGTEGMESHNRDNILLVYANQRTSTVISELCAYSKIVESDKALSESSSSHLGQNVEGKSTIDSEGGSEAVKESAMIIYEGDECDAYNTTPPPKPTQTPSYQHLNPL